MEIGLKIFEFIIDKINNIAYNSTYALGINDILHQANKGGYKMASLAEIRAKLQESQNRTSGSTGGGDNAIYPHWNMQEGKEAVVIFLPDANTSNTFFWVERAMIKLPFAGIKGETD